MHKYLSSLLFLALLSSLLGCSGASDPAPEDEEAIQLFESEGGAVGLSVETPEHVLLERATRFYESGLFQEASEVFQLLKDGYPFGPYAEFAEVKLADCVFQNHDYVTAALRYEEFAKQHPGSTSSEYAAMQIGRSYQLAHSGLGRDSSVLEKALSQFDSFIKKYPQSAYRHGVEQYRTETVKALVEHEKLVIAYYKKMGKDAACAAREEAIRKRWGDTAEEILVAESTPEPTTETIRASLDPGLTAQLAQAETAAALSSASAEEPSASELSVLSPDEVDSSVIKVDCSNNQLAFFLADQNEANALINSIGGNLQRSPQGSNFTVPGAYFEPQELDCEGLGKVRLSEAGAVSVSTTLALELFLLSHPSRVVVVTKSS